MESVHGPLSSLVSLSAAGAGLLLLGRRRQPAAPPKPTTTAGWIARCEQVLASFERLQTSLELPPERWADGQQRRRDQLAALARQQSDPHLNLALVGTEIGEKLVRFHRP